MPIHFWDDVVAFPTLQDSKALEIIEKLKRFQAYREVTLKKLNDDGLYYARVDGKGRLLFMSTELANRRCLVAIAYVPEHDIDKIYHNYNFVNKRLQRHEAALVEQVEQEVDEAEVQAIMDACQASDDSEHGKKISYINGQFIDWNDCQTQINRQSLPLIINGVPGSGKTILLLNRLLSLQQSHQSSKVDDNDSDSDESDITTARYVYIAESPILVQEIQRFWQAHPSASSGPQLVEFVDYHTFVNRHAKLAGKQIVGFDSFQAYFTRLKLTIDCETAYQELLLIAFCDYDHDAYVARGAAASHFHDTPLKAQLVTLAIEYRDYCDAQNCIDLNLTAVTLEPCVDVLAVDEAQDLSAMKVRTLLSCLRDSDPALPQVIVGCDTHQCLKQAKPNYPFLKELLCADHLKVFNLTQSYRLANKPAQFCSDLVTVSLHLTRGKSDSHEYHEIVAADNQTGDGILQWIDEPKSPATNPTFQAELEKLKPLLASADVAVIVPDEAKRGEVHKLLNPPLCLTVEESKGQEFDLVIAYGLLGSTTYQAVYATIPDLSGGVKTQMHRPKDKTDTAHLTYGRAMHELLVAMSRGRRGTIWIEAKQHKTRHIAAYCKTKIRQYQEAKPADNSERIQVAAQSTSKAAWQEKAKDLINRGLLKQAHGIIEQIHNVKLTGNLSAEALTAAIDNPNPYHLAKPVKKRKDKKRTAQKQKPIPTPRWDDYVAFCNDKAAVKRWLLHITPEVGCTRALSSVCQKYCLGVVTDKSVLSPILQAIFVAYCDALTGDDLSLFMWLFQPHMQPFQNEVMQMLPKYTDASPTHAAKVLFNPLPDGVEHSYLQTKVGFVWQYLQTNDGIAYFMALLETELLIKTGLLYVENMVLRVSVLTFLQKKASVSLIDEHLYDEESPFHEILKSLFAFNIAFEEKNTFYQKSLIQLLGASETACEFFIEQLRHCEKLRGYGLDRRQLRSNQAGFPLTTNAELSTYYALFYDYCHWNDITTIERLQILHNILKSQEQDRRYANNLYLPVLRGHMRSISSDAASRANYIKETAQNAEFLTDFYNDDGGSLFYESLQDTTMFETMRTYLETNPEAFRGVKARLTPFHVFHRAMEKPLQKNVIVWFREHFYTLDFIHQIRWNDIKISLESASHYSTADGDTMLPLAWLIFAVADGDYSVILQTLYHRDFDKLASAHLPADFFKLSHPTECRLRSKSLSAEGNIGLETERMTIHQTCLMSFPVLEQILLAPYFHKKLFAEGVSCDVADLRRGELAIIHHTQIMEEWIAGFQKRAKQTIEAILPTLSAEQRSLVDQIETCFKTRHGCWEFFMAQSDCEPTMFDSMAKTPQLITLALAKIFTGIQDKVQLVAAPVFTMLLPVDVLFNFNNRALCEAWTQANMASFEYTVLHYTKIFNLNSLRNEPSPMELQSKNHYLRCYADVMLRVLHMGNYRLIKAIFDGIFSEMGTKWLQDLFRPEMIFISPGIRCAQPFNYKAPQKVVTTPTTPNYNLAVNTLKCILLSPHQDSILRNLARLYGDKINVHDFGEKGGLLIGLQNEKDGDVALKNLYKHFPKIEEQLKKIQQLQALLAIRERNTATASESTSQSSQEQAPLRLNK